MLTTVLDTVTIAPGVRRVVLASVDGSALEPFVPGSHVLVRCAIDRYNAYSLTGECRSPTSYSISVRAQGVGSSWLHERRVGDTVDISTPRSTFAPVLSARRHLLVAGGIGVTPILSHAGEHGSASEVLYVHKPGVDAHVRDLRAVCDDVTVVTDREHFVSALRESLRRQPLGTHLYVCGPGGLIDLVHVEAAGAGWPRSRCHHERFASTSAPTRPFELHLSRGLTVHVPSHRTALDALAEAGIIVPNLCRHGVCGRCRTTVLSGPIEHRDLYLTEDERAEGDSMMVCVSRAAGDGVELEL
ncbi:ferredoxin [Rhodococcoides trifolii]|uniref:Ferredoxin n=1 Tax=Rhodococcoides trifolii TaxID=908250 RepID=A0A917CYR8_9NOCA|nr:PDR/VanB family oxidoreductase [Rhodococcus trifolii]GGG02409.1 ferredoxin [Rhodococcus trifolii]